MTQDAVPAGMPPRENGPEDIFMPDLPVVDAHIHLWNAAGYDYFAPDYLADVASGHKVEASIYIECGMAYSQDARAAFRSVGETAYVVEHVRQARAGTHQLAAGILSHADLTLGEAVRPVLEAHIEAGEGRLRGIRYRAAWNDDPDILYGAGYPEAGVLLTDAFLAGARCLAPLGLTLDIWALHPQLDEIYWAASRLPELPIAVNHVGGPLGIGRYAGRREEVFAAWSAGIRKLATLPNIQIKLGGLGISRLGWRFGPTGQARSSSELVEAWSPYIKTCVDAFGPNRSIFGSNFSVDRSAACFRVYLNAFKRMLADLSRDEIEAVFAGNARRHYRIG